MNKHMVTVWTISYLTKEKDILAQTCHHDLATANKIALELLQNENTQGVFLQSELMSARDYIMGFGDLLSPQERYLFEKEHDLFFIRKEN